MNEALRARLRGIREILMAHYGASALLPSAAKGSERETLVREFLQRVFPVQYRFGSGAVADAAGLTTGQLDIVVEFPFFASFPAPGGGERLYVAESIACVGEVKSDLATQWPQVEQTTAKVRPLRRKWRRHLQIDPTSGFSEVGPSISRVPLVAVGFKGFASVASLKKRMEETPEDQRPDCALIVESGAYVAYSGQVTDGEEGFFAFCADLSYFMRNVLMAEPDLIAHVGGSWLT
jgi:hypothetical protein